MKLLSEYFDLRTQIFEYFGYEENWRAFCLEDCTEYEWYYDLSENTVRFGSSVEQLNSPTGAYYKDVIYTYRHLEKHVYRTDDYTMILCNTQTDGNIFLRIFDNKKEHLEVNTDYENGRDFNEDDDEF